MSTAAPPGAPRRLTPRQREVYAWIYSTTRRQGYQPSYREACDRFGIQSPNAIHHFLRRVARKGYVDPPGPGTGRGESRAIRFLLTPAGRPFRGWREPDDDDHDTPGGPPCCAD